MKGGDDSVGTCCDPFVIPSRQDTDELVSRNTPPTRGVDRISDPFTVDGHSIVRLSAMSDQPFEVEVEVTETCQQTNTFRRPLVFRSIPIPIPAAIWLFGTALIGLIGFGKRKSRAAV